MILPLHLHLHLNNRNRPPVSVHLHRSVTLPTVFRHNITLPKIHTIYSSLSALQTEDGVTSNSDICSTESDNNDHVKIVAVVGEGALSPLKSASWLDVMLHACGSASQEVERFRYSEGQSEMIENLGESLLLMKFYSLQVTDEQMDIILFTKSSFITILTMKLFQNEQTFHVASEALESRNPKLLMSLKIADQVFFARFFLQSVQSCVTR